MSWLSLGSDAATSVARPASTFQSATPSGHTVAKATANNAVKHAGQGVQAKFSPKGLELAAQGADKLATAARLTAQGLGEISSATAGGIGSMAQETGDAIGGAIAGVQAMARGSVNTVSNAVSAGVEQVGDALDSVTSAAALTGLVGLAVLGA